MSLSEGQPVLLRRQGDIELSDDELAEMGVELAGGEASGDGAKKRRPVIRVPSDEVPRQGADLGRASTAPQKILSHTDALVEHAFSQWSGEPSRAEAEAAAPVVVITPDLDDEGIEPLEDDTDTEPTVISAPPPQPPASAAAPVDGPGAPQKSAPPPPLPSSVSPKAAAAGADAATLRTPPIRPMPPPPAAIDESIEDGAVLSSSPPPNLAGPRVAVAFAATGEVVDGAATVQVSAPSQREEDEELHFDEIEEVKVAPPPPPGQPTPGAAVAGALAPSAAPPPMPGSGAVADRPPPPPAGQNGSNLTPPSVAAAPSATSETRRKRRAKQWFEEVFDEDYLRTFPFMTPAQTEREVSFLTEALSLEAGSNVLDVGCGYGRHAMELAGRGHQVTGLDLSLPLLIRAADAARRVGATINFIHGDMREMTFDAEFDAAYCYFTSFGYFDDETNRSVAGLIARSLKPGGRFLLDVVNRDYIVRDLPVRVWWQGDGCMVLEEVDFNYFTSRLKVQRSIVFEDGRQVEQELSIRAYSLHEIGKVLHHAGFRVLEVSGGLALKGRYFGSDSRQIVVVAEKKKES